MRRCLVVANQTLGGAHLVELLRDLVAEEPCRIHVLVPATADPSTWVWSGDDAREAARNRLDKALTRFAEFGVEVDGEVGDERVIDAIRDVLAREPMDLIVLSTLPPGVSRWLRMDLVSRVERTFALPVVHVTAARAATA